MAKVSELLRATRSDLVDGFPCKAALSSLMIDRSVEEKLAHLNELLAADRIEVVISEEATLVGEFENIGLSAATTFASGGIVIKLAGRFFEPNHVAPLVKALRFQSLITHELVHRRQFKAKQLHASSRNERHSSTEYLNDELELSAMGAEVAHDLRALMFLGGTTVDASPRLRDLLTNAGMMSQASVTKFDKAIKHFY
jgi:hypothetical protein